MGVGAITDIIGGYNPFGWQSVNDYRPTRKSFVFKAVPTSGEIIKSPKLGGADAAIFDFEDEGPGWGVEALRISLNPVKNGDSKLVTSRLGSDYARLDGGSGRSGGLSGRRQMIVSEGNSLLTGSAKGALVELEVYV
jgi:hypothetical protein